MSRDGWERGRQQCGGCSSDGLVTVCFACASARLLLLLPISVLLVSCQPLEPAGDWQVWAEEKGTIDFDIEKGL